MLIAAEIVAVLILAVALVYLAWLPALSRHAERRADRGAVAALEQQLRIAELERDNALLALYKREAEGLAPGYHLPPFQEWRDQYRTKRKETTR